MNAEKIRLSLDKEIKIIAVKETSSTNDELKRLALSGERDTVLFVADSQTAGRGRKGRSFFSPDGTGIYMSLLIHPDLTPEECTLITPLCAVAAAEAIEGVTGIKAGIKWVNDIFIGGKKVAGILTEGSFTRKGADYVIVGIGINLSRPEGGFPEEIRETAGAVAENASELREAVAAETVNRFMHHLKDIKSRKFIRPYRERLFFLGKEITVITADGSYRATAEDIDSDCRLTVRTRSGEIKALGSGEISVKI
ncbi:MAG: biotin--[acetyl-CoA-carboxylase] ligase [Ruminococcaceae bacterium]|nr:biotin--[acetyl-CoA-carboxylase] ligase [Oscillospiraceae bacterium]MBQ9914136.1 biotin--[acetyl-CoA-carboxylase] ligase [Clostridia bacterium]